MNTVYCPVLDRQVDGNTCLEIVLVADREAKTSILPQGLESVSYTHLTLPTSDLV